MRSHSGAGGSTGATSALIRANALSFSSPSGRISLPSKLYFAGCAAGRLGVMPA